MRWFRLYGEMLNDPKVQLLPPPVFKNWINALCFASQNDGNLPAGDGAAYALRLSPAQTIRLMADLCKLGLLDEQPDGSYRPHNWDQRQWLSDSSAERVKRHRQKRADAGLLAQWACPPTLREAVYVRDSYKCVYCSSTDDLTLDHKTPEMRGGSHEEDNLQTCCRACNASKRDLTHEEFVTRTVTVPLLKRPQTTEQNRDQNTDQNQKSPPSPSGSSPPKVRDDFGTRLPADWLPSPEGRKYAIEQGFFPSDLPKIIDKFKAHYAALPGRKGLSADWAASWTKWAIDEARIQKIKPRMRVEGETEGSLGVFVHFESEAGKAWIAYYLKERGRRPQSMHRQNKEGWYFPSEFPPSSSPTSH